MVKRPRACAARPRRGSVLPWLLVSLSVIVAVVAIGLDGGRLMEERRRTQAAADAAALAAAADLYETWTQNQGRDPQGTATAAALAVAAANGYADDGTNSVVTVNIPPQSGPFAGKAECAEVIVQSRPRATFSAVFQGGGLTVTARSVGRGRPQNIGVLTLAPGGRDALLDQGNGTMRVAGPVAVNSGDKAAFEAGGNARVQADSFDVAGDYNGPASALTGTLNTGVDPTPDPFRTFPAPDPAAYPVRSTSQLILSSSGTTTLQPGVYQGGIDLSGQAQVVLQPGVYILDGGGLSLTGGASLTGNGVMIYNTGGSIDLGGGGTLRLSAPTSGTYRGICIFQDRASSKPLKLSGNTTWNVAGVVYAPRAAVSVSGNDTSLSDVLGGGYVCKKLTVNGNGSFTIDEGRNRPLVPEVGLVD